MLKKNALGKGLAALIRDASADVAANETKSSTQQPRDFSQTGSVSNLPIGLLQAGKFQPRKNFDPDAIWQLAQSIISSGIIQPILVRPMGSYYEIIAGERRFRAAQKAQLHQVPVIIRPTSDPEAIQIALIENLQRQELNPIEEAQGFLMLQKNFFYEQAQIAEVVGKSRSHIANMLRLFNLPEKIQNMIRQGQLSAGHGRALLSAQNPIALAQQVIKENLSVRQTEQYAQAKTSSPIKTTTQAKTIVPTADDRAFAKNLSQSLGLPVKLHHQPSGSGELRIGYRNLEQLHYLAKKLKGSD